MLPPRAYFFIGLNIVRTLSIIALLLVFASNIETLVHDIEAVNRWTAAGKAAHDLDSGSMNSTMTDYLNGDYIEGSTVPNQAAGIFWAVLNRLFILFQVIVLLLSELGWPMAFFNRFFPILGDDFGLGALGVIQCLLGASILSHHIDDFTLVSAFFLFSIGLLNILAGLIFRAGAKSKRSVFCWREHAKASLPTHVGPVDVSNIKAPSFVSNAWADKSNAFAGKFGAAKFPEEKGYGASSFGEKTRAGPNTYTTFDKPTQQPDPASKAGFGFGRQGEKAAGLKGYLITKPMETLPRYAAKLNAGASK
ncbi:hypothetical protein K523DRAFT_373509 [Schizophyllum commune Tattone D]|nr:hypothetical protein K523DRAFT_373509 [Schizophyllum commune Tattone D]